MPPTFDSTLLKRLQYLSLAAGSSAKLSDGGEVSGWRDYAPGDDYRGIDWVRCARHDELLTKTFKAHVDLHVYLLLDCSPSMGLGRGAKFHLARQIAAALGYVTLANLHCLSVAAFAGGIVADVPPMRHRTKMPKLLKFLEQLPLQGRQTDLARTAERFVRRYQQHGPVIVISDFYDRGGFRRGLDILRHRGYEPRVIQIHDPREIDPKLLGDLELVDAETMAVQRVTVTPRAAMRYRALAAEFRDSVRRYCARYGLACVQLAGDTAEDSALLRVLSAEGMKIR